MNHLVRTAVALLMLAGASATQAATATATANGKVVKPVELTGGGTIAFGTITTPTSATFSGTMTIQAASAQTGTYCPASFVCTGTPTAAMFNIRGTNATPLLVTIPQTITMTMTSGFTGTAPTLTVTTSNSLGANNGTGQYSMTLANSGAPGTDFYVGGAITVTQATVGGSYSGSISVTADYL